jgi:hypothetical protein
MNIGEALRSAQYILPEYRPARGVRNAGELREERGQRPLAGAGLSKEDTAGIPFLNGRLHLPTIHFPSTASFTIFPEDLSAAEVAHEE